MVDKTEQDREKIREQWRKRRARYRERHKDKLKELQPQYYKNFLESQNVTSGYYYLINKYTDPNFVPNKKQLDKINKAAQVAFEYGGLVSKVLEEKYNLTLKQVNYLAYTKVYKEKLQQLRNIHYMKRLVELLIEVRRNVHEQYNSVIAKGKI